MTDNSNPSGSPSIPRARAYWYIVCESKALGTKPLSVTLWSQELVLFRGKEGKPSALLNRCAHRNVPLSDGRCDEGIIQCPYHGWKFNGQGHCVEVPAQPGCETGQSHAVPAHSVRESQGYVWVYGAPNQLPHGDPYLFPHLDDRSYIHVRYQADFDANIHATAENILDVPHTAFLHKGLFRGGEPNRIRTEVTHFSDRVECQFLDEPRPSGVLGKILAPGGGDGMYHCDRFILPSVAQVEYRLGDRGHLMTTSSLTPLSDWKTRMYAIVSIRKSFWLQLLRPVITPVAMKVVRQDQEMLIRQTSAVREAGEHYAYTNADTLGPGIIKLLRKAARESVSIQPINEEDPLQTVKGELWV